MQLVDEATVAGRLRELVAAHPPEPPRVVVSGNHATPWALVRLLDQHLEQSRCFVLNPQTGWPCRQGLVTESPFVGPGARHDPWLDYLPMRLSLVPRLFGSARPPDAVLVHTSTPRRGRISMGIEVNILPAAIEQVRRRGGLVVAQVNPRMPHTLGDAEIDVGTVDLALEVDVPIPSPPPPVLDAVADAVGERVAALGTDGGTIQMGIGQMPDAAACHLRTRRGLGVWSEMVSDGVLDLERSGALDGSRPITATFMFGSPDLYAWADENPRLLMGRTEVVNDPARISAQPAMLSINTALQVDLFAQANASYVNHRIHSGFGGQPDFVVGALHSTGGQAVIAMRSWHDKTDSSTIVPLLTEPACSFQHSAVVTEHGAATIFGSSQHAQARLLIESTADPRARAGLREAAGRLGLLRPGEEP